MAAAPMKRAVGADAGGDDGPGALPQAGMKRAVGAGGGGFQESQRRCRGERQESRGRWGEGRRESRGRWECERRRRCCRFCERQRRTSYQPRATPWEHVRKHAKR